MCRHVMDGWTDGWVDEQMDGRMGEGWKGERWMGMGEG